MSIQDIVALANAMRGMNTDEIWSANIPSTTDDSTGVSYVVALEDELAAMMERVDAGEDPRGPQTIGSTTDVLPPSVTFPTMKRPIGLTAPHR